MIIPFVLLVSLIMNLLIENQNGGNPLLEIVLNNNNFFSFILLFLTTTLIAPLFEKIFKNLKWNWDFGIALVALIWLWIFFSIVGIFSQTELGQWLGDLS